MFNHIRKQFTVNITFQQPIYQILILAIINIIEKRKKIDCSNDINTIRFILKTLARYKQKIYLITQLIRNNFVIHWLQM